MAVHVAVVSSSQEGYRITTALEGDPVGNTRIERAYSNGVQMAEAFARQLIENEGLKKQLEEVAECLKAYEPQTTGNNVNWEASFKGLKRDVEEALGIATAVF